MSARKIRGHWYVDLRNEGRRVRKRSPDDSRAGAIAYEATLRNRLARGEPIVPLPPKPPPPRFEHFAWRWFHTYVETNNKPSEQRGKRYTLSKHLVPCFGKLTIDAITLPRVEEFKAMKLNTGLSPKTINNFLAVLGRCLRTAEEWGELDRAPRVKLLSVPPQKFDFLQPEEAAKLIVAAKAQPWQAMITVALRTGLRLGELVALDWSDIDLDGALLTVRRSIFRNQIVSPKSNRIRHVPLTQQAWLALHAIQTSSGRVFSCGSIPVSDQMAQRAIPRFCAEAGIRRVGWHTLRHSFASHLVTAGVSIRAVQELLGHSDIRTTMRYAHLAPSALREAILMLEAPLAAEATFGQQAGNAPNTIELQTTETPQFAGRS